MVSGRSSLTDAPCSSASSPTSASCGWQSPAAQRRSSLAWSALVEGAAAEAAGGPVREAGGRVGEADPLLAGEAEEVAQRRQPEAAIAAGGEERLDVGARAGRPVAHAVAVEVRGELGEDREALLDRVIGERAARRSGGRARDRPAAS